MRRRQIIYQITAALDQTNEKGEAEGYMRYYC